MKNRRIIFQVSTLLLLAGLFATACRKYEDGPTFSLKTKKARIENNWNAFLVARNNIDESEFFETYNFVFSKNGDMTWTLKKKDEDPLVRMGSWELASVKEEIKLTMPDSSGGQDQLLFLGIRKLETDEMWVRFLMEGDYWDLQMR